MFENNLVEGNESDNLKGSLQKYFGFNTFKGEQELIINNDNEIYIGCHSWLVYILWHSCCVINYLVKAKNK